MAHPIYEKEETRIAAITRDIRILCWKDSGMPASGTVSLQPMEFTLARGSLEDQELQYTALSYTWGAPEFTEEILINGHRFLITPNLYSALLRIRQRKELTNLWIDAICINQNDNLEKSWQVAQMGDVYKQARDVVIWLGEPTSASGEEAFLTLGEIGTPFLASGLKHHFSVLAGADGKLKNAFAAASMVTIWRLIEPIMLDVENFHTLFPSTSTTEQDHWLSLSQVLDNKPSYIDAAREILYFSRHIRYAMCDEEEKHDFSWESDPEWIVDFLLMLDPDPPHSEHSSLASEEQSREEYFRGEGVETPDLEMTPTRSADEAIDWRRQFAIMLVEELDMDPAGLVSFPNSYPSEYTPNARSEVFDVDYAPPRLDDILQELVSQRSNYRAALASSGLVRPTGSNVGLLDQLYRESQAQPQGQAEMENDRRTATNFVMICGYVLRGLDNLGVNISGYVSRSVELQNIPDGSIGAGIIPLVVGVLKELLSEALISLARLIQDNSVAFEELLHLKRNPWGVLLPFKSRDDFPSENQIDGFLEEVEKRELATTAHSQHFHSRKNENETARPRPPMVLQDGELHLSPEPLSYFLEAAGKVVSNLHHIPAIRELLGQPWFQRVWVVQELLMAEHPVFLFGASELPCDVLDGAISCLSSDSHIFRMLEMARPYGILHGTEAHGLDGLDQRARMMMTLRSQFQQTKMSLMEFLARTRFENFNLQHALQATDPRDYIFAFLGVAMDTKAMQLLPNYVKDTQKVFTDATMAILQTGDLSLLAMCRGESRPSVRPSWVPDFEKTTRRPFCLGRIFEGAVDHSPNLSFREDGVGGHRLLLSAIKLGEVQQVATPLESFRPTAQILRTGASILHEASRSTGGSMTDWFEQMMDADLDEDSDTSTFAVEFARRLLGSFSANKIDSSVHGGLSRYREWLLMIGNEFCISRPPTAQLFDPGFDTWEGDTLGRALIADCLAGMQHSNEGSWYPVRLGSKWSKQKGSAFLTYLISGWTQRAVPSQGAPPVQAESNQTWRNLFRLLHFVPDPRELADFQADRVEAAMQIELRNEGMRPMKVDGQFGIAPKATSRGDLVIMPLGSRVPFIIRRLQNESYTLLGEAYVNGFMDGELMDSVREVECFSIG